MSFYVYNTDSQVAGSHDNQWKLHHAMQPEDQTVGDFFLPVGAGTVTVTGVGFRPDAIIFVSAIGSENTHPSFTYGCATSTDPSQQWSAAGTIGAGTIGGFFTRFWYSEWYPGLCMCGVHAESDSSPPTTLLRATLQSFNSDGFTLNILEHNNDAPARVAFLALKGKFKAGVIPVGDSIPSLPFTPTGVWFAGVKRTGPSTGATIDWCNGFASKNAIDPVQSQQSLWSGNRQPYFTAWHHWQTTSRYCPGYLANWGLAQDLDSSPSLFGSYELWGKCRVSSWASNAIMLEWSELKDGTPFQFGYLAMGEPCETGRFNWEDTSFLPDRTVSIYPIEPSAFSRIGYMIPTLLEKVNVVLGMAPIAFGGSSGTYHTWAQQYDTLGELARGFDASFSVGAIDRTKLDELGNYGRWVTSEAGFSEPPPQPPRTNDVEPKSDEWLVTFAEAAGSSATFYMSTTGTMRKGASFPQANMTGNGSFFGPYEVSVGRWTDIIHLVQRKKNHLPRLHVGP